MEPRWETCSSCCVTEELVKSFSSSTGFCQPPERGGVGPKRRENGGEGCALLHCYPLASKEEEDDDSSPGVSFSLSSEESEMEPEEERIRYSQRLVSSGLGTILFQSWFCCSWRREGLFLAAGLNNPNRLVVDGCSLCRGVGLAYVALWVLLYHQVCPNEGNLTAELWKGGLEVEAGEGALG